MFIVMNILLVQPKKSDHCILNYWEEVNIMNKTDLVNAVADKGELSKKDAAKAVDAVFESVMDSLKAVKKYKLSALVTLKYVNVLLEKDVILKLVRKYRFLLAKFQRLKLVKLLEM